MYCMSQHTSFWAFLKLAIKGGPKVKFGTKCPSIISMCSQSQPLSRRKKESMCAFMYWEKVLDKLRQSNPKINRKQKPSYISSICWASSFRRARLHESKEGEMMVFNVMVLCIAILFIFRRMFSVWIVIGRILWNNNTGPFICFGW